MLRLSLEALQIVDAIDRRGSFSSAGKELHKVPSTISYTVAKLEDDLGVQVFQRNGPKVMLTAAGQELLKEGRYLLKAAQDLEHRVRRVASGWETELSIGIDSMFSAVALADDVRAFYDGGAADALAPVARHPVGHLGSAAGPAGRLAGGRAWRRARGRRLYRAADRHAGLRVHRGAHAPAGAGGRNPCRAATCSSTGPSSWPIRRARWRRAPWVLLLGQDALSVPNMQVKFDYQVLGLGFGFLPGPCARAAIARGLLVEKAVEEPKPSETFYLAWRVGEDGAALRWWMARMREPDVFARLALHLPGRA